MKNIRDGDIRMLGDDGDAMGGIDAMRSRDAMHCVSTANCVNTASVRMGYLQNMKNIIIPIGRVVLDVF